jgi:hypothetical protein
VDVHATATVASRNSAMKRVEVLEVFIEEKKGPRQG